MIIFQNMYSTVYRAFNLQMQLSKKIVKKDPGVYALYMTVLYGIIILYPYVISIDTHTIQCFLTNIIILRTLLYLLTILQLSK